MYEVIFEYHNFIKILSKSDKINIDVNEIV